MSYFIAIGTNSILSIDTIWPYSPASGNYILPGSGWNGATSVPAAQGSASALGYGQPVIADWDCVPYQTVSGVLRPSIIAWHINVSGIKNVEFAANGGSWVSCSGISLNEDTNIVEYWATARASDYPDGQTEFRARIYPHHGECVVLSGMYVYMNYSGTLDRTPQYVSSTGNDTTGNGSSGNPYATIAKACDIINTAYGSLDGGIIILKAGSYEAATGGSTVGGYLRSTNRWLEIRADNGLSRSQVQVTHRQTSPGNYWGITDKTKFNGVMITNSFISDNNQLVWYDNCNLFAGSRTSNTSFTGGDGNLLRCYGTNINISGVLNAFKDGRLIRNYTIDNIGSDALSGTATAISGTISNIIQADEVGAHADIYQSFSRNDDIIIYGLKDGGGTMITQGLFGGGTPSRNNWAITNCKFRSSSAAFYVGGDPYENVLIKNCDFADGATWLEGFITCIDVVLEDVTWGGGSPNTFSGVTIRTTGGGGGGSVTINPVQSTSVTIANGNSTTVAFSSNVTSGNLIVIAISTYTGDMSTGTVTDTLGNTYSMINQQAADANSRVSIWHTISGSTGSCTITINPAGASADISACATEFASPTGTPLDDFDGTTGTGSPITNNITTTTSKAVLFVAMTHTGSSLSLSAYDSNWSQIGENENNSTAQALWFGHRDALSATDYQARMTGGGGTYAIIGAAFKITP